ncbi:hypothetical protein [Paenibacillus polymyxa]|uniref:Uncharacterized protein n=1 Tax=Paenibacillus polymyxa (strain SC2) TaxID=886882 RepID=E3EK41_PAEPS|nr:hypothetical protein [Paenibacillus polymyxa]ADO59750.1 hypothetical protein PPSC2_26430 [Paenibacillus polymyxa SC2]WPQ60016.1 hypothetical protein SKN87_27625 [Paenibacillus polymyxa]
MKVKRLKEILESLDEKLENVDDDLEVFIRNSVNPCGNIQELEQVEFSTYGFFGKAIPCLILNTDSSKTLETNKEDEVIYYISSN